MQQHFTDRSRTETYQRCHRQRFLEYHEAGVGIVPTRRALPLAVGGAVHAGIEVLLLAAQAWEAEWHQPASNVPQPVLLQWEEQAVREALTEFADETCGGVELDLSERSAMQSAGGFEEYQKQLAASLGTTPEEAGLEQLAQRHAANVSEFDRYLREEQAALVEGMVRAYARRRLRPLLEQFEVMEVEREGTWLLSSWASDSHDNCPTCECSGGEHDHELWFMFRPDALLRERSSNQLYILSLKTTGAWDIRKERDAQRDMQGLSEGVEVERRLGKWWQEIKNYRDMAGHEDSFDDTFELWIWGKESSRTMFNFLLSCPAPPRILAIRYEYLLKGERWRDKELSARLGLDVRTQRSPLIRQYVAVSVPQRGQATYRVGDVCWSWDYIKEDGSAGSLAWQNWKLQAVWNSYSHEWKTGVDAWIDALDDSHESMSAYDSTVGLEPRALGWKSRAQALGYTAQHPLDSVFVPPIVVYRNDDELRDWVEQIAYQEQEVAEHVAAIRELENVTTFQREPHEVNEGHRRSLLNQYFPMTRRACEYPSTCAFVKLCFGGEDIRRDPVASGQYVTRVPNHPIEGAR